MKWNSKGKNQKQLGGRICKTKNKRAKQRKDYYVRGRRDEQRMCKSDEEEEEEKYVRWRKRGNRQCVRSNRRQKERKEEKRELLIRAGGKWEQNFKRGKRKNKLEKIREGRGDIKERKRKKRQLVKVRRNIGFQKEKERKKEACKREKGEEHK